MTDPIKPSEGGSSYPVNYNNETNVEVSVTVTTITGQNVADGFGTQPPPAGYSDGSIQVNTLLINDGGQGDIPLTPAQRSELSLIGLLCQRNPPSPGLQSRWAGFITDVRANGGCVDPMAFIQMVLRESYAQSMLDMKFYAEKVKFYNDTKKLIREEIKRANEHLLQYTDQEGGPIEPFELSKFPGEFMGVTDPQAEVLAGGQDTSVLSGGGIMDYDGEYPTPLTPPLPGGVQKAFVTSPGGFLVAFVPQGNKVLIYDASGKKIYGITGDPHVDEDGDGESDWHFSDDSTFILPDGTKICCNCEEKEPGSGKYYVVGLDVLSGTHRGSVGLGQDGEDREGEIASDRAEFDATLKDAVAGTGSGVFVIQPGGSTLMKTENGFVAVTPQEWDAYLESQTITAGDTGYDITADPINMALGDDQSLVRRVGCANTKEELEQYKEDLEQQLETLGEDGTLANYDLQNATQRQQACMQLMSALSKLFHETITGIIRKMGN